nr:hypothetical protein [Pseudomonas syringae]
MKNAERDLPRLRQFQLRSNVMSRLINTWIDQLLWNRLRFQALRLRNFRRRPMIIPQVGILQARRKAAKALLHSQHLLMSIGRDVVTPIGSGQRVLAA